MYHQKEQTVSHNLSHLNCTIKKVNPTIPRNMLNLDYTIKCTNPPPYRMSRKSRPILYCILLYKMGQDFMDIQYHQILCLSRTLPLEANPNNACHQISAKA